MHRANLLHGSNVLICSPNWLGDCIMAMPALQAAKRRRPDLRLRILCKPQVAGIWEMHPAAGSVIAVAPGMRSMMRAVAAVKALRCSAAFVLPNSFRSAMVPQLAGIRTRIGMAGHQRAWMLTRVVQREADNGARHQSLDYFRILGLEPDTTEMPRLSIPPSAIESVSVKIGGRAKGLVGLIPGAARGPSKRWPPEYWAELGKWLASMGMRVVVLGAGSETELCGTVCAVIGGAAVNLAGRTTIQEFAATLSMCRTVVANDSGGMHVAAAVGVPVVAVFGTTDPARTGPMGMAHRLVMRDGVQRSSEIGRRSALAEDILRSIRPERVISAVGEVLNV